MTQEKIILNVLRERGVWVPSWDLQKANTRFGWLGISADREARRMAEQGLIERQRKGKYTFYKVKGKAFGERKYTPRVVKQAEDQERLL